MTSIATDLDFDRNGRQVGVLRLPHSPHHDAWGSVAIPAAVIKNGSGPTLLLTGGNHGDEYEGPVVLGELIRDLDPAAIQGRLIILPAMNTPAVKAGRRTSPVDGLNINRTFPGDPSGSTTRQISHYVANVLMPMADVFIDLHSGGSSLDFIPSAFLERSPDPELRRRGEAAVRAYGAPLAVVADTLGEARTSTATAAARGMIALGSEMGGGGVVDPEALAICRRAVRNLLVHFAVADGPAASPAYDGPLYEISGHASHVYAADDGVFVPADRLGTSVSAGQPAGAVHFLTDPGRAPEPLVYGQSGLLICHRAIGRVEAGNCVAVVASPIG
ncbi:MAG: succinylglutamate desuccinylase/aspartoacylase family protein [Alphaproteobacteria bacterium]